jgi:phosphoglycolate phosphatase-like HAD superfamily hydrolase
MAIMDHHWILKNIIPERDFFIGIDSDGCVFDTMEIKQKEFFIPNALKYFDLHSISGVLRETWEFVNLYSIYRGGNRFISLIKVFDFLKDRKEVKDSGVRLPDLVSLRGWIESETKLSNLNLRKYIESNGDPELERVLLWSEAINKEIANNLGRIPPFPNALKAIREISSYADLVIVSQTPLEALEREWEEHDIRKYVRIIAGQEHGTKTEHIFQAAKGKYPDNKILMIGDAMGDLDAARNNGILFYPVIPGKEDDAWKRFITEGMAKFIKGSYSGDYEGALLAEFKKSLPDRPFWKQ